MPGACQSRAVTEPQRDRWPAQIGAPARPNAVVGLGRGERPGTLEQRRFAPLRPVHGQFDEMRCSRRRRRMIQIHGSFAAYPSSVAHGDSFPSRGSHWLLQTSRAAWESHGCRIHTNSPARRMASGGAALSYEIAVQGGENRRASGEGAAVTARIFPLPRRRRSPGSRPGSGR